MTGVESFPPSVQIALSMVGFIIAVAVWAYGVLKKPGVAVSKDVVVPNINVMDGETIRDAAKILRESIAQNDARERLIRGVYAELQLQTDLMRETIQVMESVDNRLKTEYLSQRQRREEAGRS